MDEYLPLAPQSGALDRELRFTEVYRETSGLPAPIREARCLETMVPSNLYGIREGDLFAGRTDAYQLVGFSLEEATGGPVYYCWEDRVLKKLEILDASPQYRRRVQEMLEFWKTEATAQKFKQALPGKLLDATESPIGDMFGRLSGVCLDFEKLCRLGVPGLRSELAKGATDNPGSRDFYTGMELALDLFCHICTQYAEQARRMEAQDGDAARRRELARMADILEKLPEKRPATLREAMQLCWLYALVSGVVNYGRMDVYLGDFYAQDIDSDVLTEDEALGLICSLWKLVADRKIGFNGRVIIGGRGRANERNADRFALAAMEATRRVEETEPQLSLRFYKGMNPALMQKALDVIGGGRIYPMLYNDDVNVGAVEKAFVVSSAEAEQYVPYGCGEYALDHASFGSPDCSINLAKALEAVLHNGLDAQTGRRIGPQTGNFAEFTRFEQLYRAYCAQVEFSIASLARRDGIETRIKAKSAAYLYCSMLFGNCVERGRSLVDGGAEYLGSVVETFGMVNAADSLTAIREAVFEKHLFGPAQLLKMLDADFKGYEREQAALLALPKYGNDDDQADAMMCRVSSHICAYAREQASENGFGYYLAVNINNFGNVHAGYQTAASADGRPNGGALANGNTPTAGRDEKGVTAFLKSIVKPDPTVHAGYVHNMKFNRMLFNEQRPKLEALLGTYFAMGGTQAMITVLNRGDLENALREPEKYRNLIVRVGGFSARFVELEPDVQADILARTLY